MGRKVTLETYTGNAAADTLARSHVDDDAARAMALGDLHPETRIPIEDQWPDFKPVALRSSVKVSP